jgi:hypothetical protein
VLVRYNPEGDAEMNSRQTERLKRLATGSTSTTGSSCSSCSCPARSHQLEQVGGDSDRYDAELRPELMRRAIVEFQEPASRPDIWKIEGIDTQEDCERISRDLRRDGRDGVICVVLGRGATTTRSRTGSARAPGGGLRRLRDRPHDLVGRAQGLPRRDIERRTRRRRSPRSTSLRAGVQRGGAGARHRMSALLRVR